MQILKMKTIITFVIILFTLANCFSQQQAIVTNVNKEPTPGSGLVNSNGTGGDEIVPASAATLRDYEQHPERWQNEQMLAIALGYIGEKNVEQAITSYKAFLSVRPNNTRAIRGLGNCYIITHEIDAAISQFKKGWALGDDLSLLELANMYCIYSHRYQDLKPLIPDLVKLRERSDDGDVKHEITHILIVYSFNGTPAGDKQLFLSAIKGLSDDFILEREDTTESVIHGLDTFGEQERANRLREEISRRKDAELSFKAGNNKSSARDYAGAIADYSKAIELEPHIAGIYYNRGNAEDELGNYKLAVADYAKAIELDPKCVGAYNNGARAKFELGDTTGAIKDYTRTIEFYPAYSRGYQDLGHVQANLHQWRPALGNFRKALQLDPTLDFSRLYIWLIRSRLGEQEDATKELAACLKSTQNVKTNDWPVKIGQFLLGSLNKEELLRAAEDNLEAKNVQLCQAYYFIGMKFLIAGDPNSAAEAFQKSIETGAARTMEFYDATAELRALRAKGAKRP